MKIVTLVATKKYSSTHDINNNNFPQKFDFLNPFR